MSSNFGKNLILTLFGQSHGKAVGAVLDGLPAGEAVDLVALRAFVSRRTPGRYLTSPRTEDDQFDIISGLYNETTAGSPLCVVLANQDAVSTDYDATRDTPRPGHADYTAHVRHSGKADMRGGGHHSGRLTAPLTVAGGICAQLLARRNIHIGAHIASIGAVEDALFDPTGVTQKQLNVLNAMSLPLLSADKEAAILEEVRQVAASGDSIGGVIECCILGYPPGIGEPIFDGIENRISAMLFAIPGVKGVEFGNGFSAAQNKGSENNDVFTVLNGQIRTETNRHGGILGGISSGMPILFRVAFKPTPSIALPQQSVSLTDKRLQTLQLQGRHDPCIALRAAPCIEAAAAIVALDFLLGGHQ